MDRQHFRYSIRINVVSNLDVSYEIKTDDNLKKQKQNSGFNSGHRRK